MTPFRIPPAGVCTISDFTDDFQALLIPLLEYQDPDNVPETVTTVLRDVSEYREEFLEEVGNWREADFSVLLGLVDTIGNNPDCIPPLVVQGSFLRDGYHRVGALYWLGITYWPVIELQET